MPMCHEQGPVLPSQLAERRASYVCTQLQALQLMGADVCVWVQCLLSGSWVPGTLDASCVLALDRKSVV